MSLIFPSDGSISIFGKELKDNREYILSRIGAIIEKPDFYNYLTAIQNLEMLNKLQSARLSKDKLYETLELVGLKGREKSKVKTFSQGMKQRLGFAQALMHNPDLIILDEPTNGLDPQGVKDVRDLILKLNKEQGKTILISSHILSEIEIICNRMIIIQKGSKVVEGSVNELLSFNELHVSFEFEDDTKNISNEKAIELRALSLFQNIDALGNYSNPQWFLSLDKMQLIKYVRELIDIWNYRSQIDNETKRNIFPPHGDPFRHFNMTYIHTESNLHNIKKVILEVMEKLVNSGVDKDSKSLGAIYVLGSLTLVNSEAATSIPWLFQSFAYF
jgi:ABC-type multidrug transport system ATPase subunit